MAGGNETMNKAFVKYFSANILLPDELVFGIDKKVNIVKVKKSNGVYSVPVELNGVLKIDFIFDSGASDVSISPDVAMTLLRTGTIKKEDWLEGAYYKFADGSVAKSKRFKLSSIKVGNKIIRDVTCSISNSIDAPMLLGQSVLSRFGKYTFDNVNQKLIID
jgi:aspartyl protease family protein